MKISTTYLFIHIWEIHEGFTKFVGNGDDDGDDDRDNDDKADSYIEVFELFIFIKLKSDF